MKLEQYPPEKLKREVKDIVGRHLDLNEYRVFFFGSRVNGRTDDRADIDIGIEGPERVPAVAFANIQEELEKIPVLYTFDVVDFAEVGPHFKKRALRETEPVG